MLAEIDLYVAPRLLACRRFQYHEAPILVTLVPLPVFEYVDAVEQGVFLLCFVIVLRIEVTVIIGPNI